MPFSYFLPPPAELDPEQQAAWARRHYVADCAVKFLASKSKPLDSYIAAHLQDYIAGQTTLGQAIGRIVDHFARQSADFGSFQHQ